MSDPSKTPSATTVIPYGTAGISDTVARAIRSGDLGGLNTPGAPVAFPAEEPLRMSGMVHPFTAPPQAQDLSHAETQLAFLEAHVAKLCGGWAKPQLAFVAAYFAAIRRGVEASEQALAERTGALAGLVEPLHWAFAMPMPLARAHVMTDADPERAVRVDFAFWTGTGGTIVEVGGGSVMPSRRAELARLAGHGWDILQLSSAAPDGLLATLGFDLAALLSGVSRAESPFRGRGIPAPA